MALIARWTDFLPDAQGLMERRASPLARILVLAITGMFGVMLCWMAWAEVEQVVRAEGQIEPQGRAKIINHSGGGKVAEILVREGDHVAAGTMLVRFDPEVRLGERADMRARLTAATASIARLEGEAENREPAFPALLAEADPMLVQEERRLSDARADLMATAKQALDEQIRAKAADTKAAAAEIARLRNSLSLQRQQLDAVRELAAKELYPRMKLVAVEQQVAELAGELAKAEQRLVTARAELDETRARLAAVDTERRSRALGELTALRAERDRLVRLLQTQDTLLQGLTVTAPVAGFVQELQVSAAGQSVAANHPIMKLIPSDEGLVVAARVRNADVGHLTEGMPARIKVHAFDFVRFGAINGRLQKIASDARRMDPDTEPVYAVTVVTDDEAGEAGRRIQPGMLVDVEIQVGKRTVLDYLTDRLRRIGDEAFSEL
ncbi:MAG TPA: HlyD family type I secretion periplasmic adaptor subunit [Geminicoccus sp.]|jgi:HlyD family type I secretion membrane fusion protein|uniref:HlyD family type I secretion periplasmic adaptor subunit n=1 Tax=Geminicoccus sp. TaxID=2024832 RepID=UPI002E33D44B|nr:HlyD family type I secretion periplasmic adaptor subunit [Geminicoccus sp.]HEX2524714.1 HlyD family type I secretion periplasmic adaptor subunit [Geminicoccus sp.]